MQIVLDVSRGCRYLEQQHFIHRDIAARNCLVSSKGADRVVKIGGMLGLEQEGEGGQCVCVCVCVLACSNTWLRFLQTLSLSPRLYQIHVTITHTHMHAHTL